MTEPTARAFGSPFTLFRESDEFSLHSQPSDPEAAAGLGPELTAQAQAQGLDPAFLGRIISSAVTAALSAQASSSHSNSNTGKYIKPSDLPVFKGFSLDGGDTSAFLDSLETQFLLANTPENQKTYYASLAFPSGSPAHSWFREQRDLGVFRRRGDPPDVLRYDLFTQAFKARFETPLARRYALEDLWDKFTQKGTVAEHYIKFTKLWNQLQQLKIQYPPDVVASRYLRSLKSDLFYSVCQKNQTLPDLETVHRQAVEAEYQLRPTPHRPGPELRGIFGQNNKSKEQNRDKDKTKDKDKGKPRKGDKYCIWHKWNDSHTTEECTKIKELKEKGEWKGKD
jgi:Retrotransposon gag protein